MVLPVNVTEDGIDTVGLPLTPSPFVKVISFAVPVRVRPTKVSAAVCVNIPLVLYAANEVNVASYACTLVPIARPKLVLAVAASVALVPPWAISIG